MKPSFEKDATVFNHLDHDQIIRCGNTVYSLHLGFATMGFVAIFVKIRKNVNFEPIFVKSVISNILSMVYELTIQ